MSPIPIATTTAAVLLMLLGAAGVRAASNPLPPFREVYDLLRTNLIGFSAEDFEQNATQALLTHFAGRVLLPEATVGDTQAPSIAHRTTFDQFYPYVRVGHVDARLGPALSELVTDTNTVARSRGLVLDLRFAQGSDYSAAAKAASLFVAPGRPLLDWGEGSARSSGDTNSTWTLPVAILVNSRTTGAAEALAGVLREAGVALLIGGQTAGQAGLFKEFTLSTGQRLRVAVASVKTGNGEPIPSNGIVPDIAVATRTEHELAWLNDPFTAVAATTNLLGATNKIVSSVTVRRRVNEAELVRAQKAGQNPDSDPSTNPPASSRAKSTAAGNEAATAAVRDPVLGRALDLLKGLSVIRGR